MKHVSVLGGLGQRAGAGLLVQEDNANECGRTSALQSASLVRLHGRKMGHGAADRNHRGRVSNKLQSSLCLGPSGWDNMAVTWIYVCSEV
jgi:hypothetical protein